MWWGWSQAQLETNACADIGIEVNIFGLGVELVPRMSDEIFLWTFAWVCFLEYVGFNDPESVTSGWIWSYECVRSIPSFIVRQSFFPNAHELQLQKKFS